MDEMEEYRNGIEHRRGERRQTSDRRYVAPPRKMLDADFWIGMAIFVVMGLTMYFSH